MEGRPARSARGFVYYEKVRFRHSGGSTGAWACGLRWDGAVFCSGIVRGLSLIHIWGERPVMDKKYDILKHPYIKLTEDGGAAPYVLSLIHIYNEVSIAVCFENLPDTVVIDATNETTLESEYLLNEIGRAHV